MAARSSRKGEPENPDPKGLYATLGVAKTADEAEIRKAYRRLALRWHPDKNPGDESATAEFQKISAAYEVLSDADRREMYDTTGCIDAEELEEADADRAQHIFAAFFGGCTEDLDPDEQAMLDEFLRLTGGGAFRMKGRRRKGRGGRAKSSRASMSEQMLGEAFMASMFGELGQVAMRFEPICPKGHGLKRKKADAAYECDVCSRDIEEGKRFFDCRKCDFSMCQKCEKKAEQEATAEQEENEGLEELFEGFCDAHLRPVRKGKTLQFQCDLCEKMLLSQQAAAEHMAEAHEEEFKVLLEEFQEAGSEAERAGGGMPSFGAGGFEAFLMAGMEEMMMGGSGLGRGGGRGARARPRKKR